MDGSQIALLIGATAALITAFGGIIVALSNIRSNAQLNAHRFTELEKTIEDLQRDNAKLQMALEVERNLSDKEKALNRRNIIWLGESTGGLRSDIAAMGLLINQLFNQFEQATGRKPEVNIEMLKELHTLKYVTGPLGPLEIPDR